jgi:hypothetical protein
MEPPKGGLPAQGIQTDTIDVDAATIPEMGMSVVCDYQGAQSEYVKHMRVYVEYWPFERLWNWCWGIKTVDDCLGIVTYDIRDELAKEQAELFARNLRVLAVRGKLQGHIGVGVTVTRIGIQVATPLLDEVVTIIENAYEPSFTGLAAAVPLVGSIAKGLAKADNLGDLARAARGTPGPTPIRSAPQLPRSLLDNIVADANRVASRGGAITESQATILRQNLPVVQRRGSAATQQIRREFVSRQADLIAEWEAQTGRKWPDGATPHHIIPLESGGANAWWNLMPTHGSLPNHSLPCIPGPHAAGGVLRDTIQQGRRAVPPGTKTDLRRPQ